MTNLGKQCSGDATLPWQHRGTGPPFLIHKRESPDSHPHVLYLSSQFNSSNSFMDRRSVTPCAS